MPNPSPIQQPVPEAASPPVPDGVGQAGAELWRSIVDVCDLRPDELVMLRQAAIMLDRLRALEAVVADEGVMTINGKGDHVAHPALVESRLLLTVLQRALAGLKIPEEGDEPPRSPGRPSRGSYRPRAV